MRRIPIQYVPREPLSVSVLIRARNEAKWLGTVLQGIRAQHKLDVVGDVEIIVLDDNSTDATREIARAGADRVFALPRGSFTYGRALNLGVQEAVGAITVQLSAHCVPVNEFWLANLVRPFMRDPQLAGVFGRDLLWPDATVGDWAKEIVQAVLGGAMIQSRYITSDRPRFSNSNSACRRDVVLRYPFCEPIKSGEDAIWAEGILPLGWRVYFCAEAMVWHSHHASLLEVARVGLRAMRTNREYRLLCPVCVR